jgi:hypothetical protein
MYGMGYELPDAFLREVALSEYSGDLNYKKCVLILDETIFKDSAVYDAPSESFIEGIKMQLLNSLVKRNGASSVLGEIVVEYFHCLQIKFEFRIPNFESLLGSVRLYV